MRGDAGCIRGVQCVGRRRLAEPRTMEEVLIAHFFVRPRAKPSLSFPFPRLLSSGGSGSEGSSLAKKGE
jgi:hypothetical protein